MPTPMDANGTTTKRRPGRDDHSGGRNVALFGLICILSLTLYPFRLQVRQTLARPGFTWRLPAQGAESPLDIVENVGLSAPLAFGLALYFRVDRRMRDWTNLLAVLLISAALSYVIETTQLFIPGRYSDFNDVLSNTAGGMLGFLACFVYLRRNLKACLLAYVIHMYIISIPLQWTSSLANWNDSYPLLLGNERTLNRPWVGRVWQLMIADRALTEAEVKELSVPRDPESILGDHLIARYSFGPESPFRDETGSLPDLLIRGTDRPPSDTDGIAVGRDRWLETARPPVALTRRLKRTDQFTLAVTVATGRLDQGGPARIVSFSRSVGDRNFTLGQHHNGLVFRLRTLLTGANGTPPELFVPGVFQDTEPHFVVVTYGGSRVRAYVDGNSSPEALTFSPGAAAFAFLAAPATGRGMNAYNAVYYVLVFVPVGVLVYLTAATLQFKRMAGFVLVLAGSAAACVGFEAMLNLVARQCFDPERVLMGTAVCMTGAACFRAFQHSRGRGVPARA
jgi:glycopeptide antibiotics resistance protein